MHTYLIFGKRIAINLINSRESEILNKELLLYPKIDEISDLKINYVGGKLSLTGKITSNNPAIHISTETGFVITIGKVQIEYIFQNQSLIEVNFAINNNISSLKSFIGKWKNMQFAKPGVEDIGQLFHELILIPIVFFFRDYSLVHASSVFTPSGKSIVFGGTGGVGKTSIELELCKSQGSSFISDDIVPVNNQGMIFPNLAYPKIYAYNIIGNEKIYKELFSNRFTSNYLQWKLLLYLKGKSGVRRRISPVKFYGNIVNDSKKISCFCLLNRTNTKETLIRKSDPDEIANLNTSVMLSEYGVFLNHVYWHQYNSSLENKLPFISLDNFIKCNTENLIKALHDCDTYIIDIPLVIDHNKFKKDIIQLLSKNELL